MGVRSGSSAALDDLIIENSWIRSHCCNGGQQSHTGRF